MSDLIIRASVLNEDIAHALLIDGANLGRDQRVGARHHNSGLDAVGDNPAPGPRGKRLRRDAEVLVHGAAGRHVVAGGAAEGRHDGGGDGARDLAADVEQVREAVVLGAVDGGAERDGALDDVGDAVLGHGDVEGLDAALGVAHDVDLLPRARLVAHLAEEVGDLGRGVAHRYQAADPGHRAVRAVRQRERAVAPRVELLLQHVEVDLAVGGEPVQQHYRVAVAAAVEVVVWCPVQLVQLQVLRDVPGERGAIGRGVRPSHGRDGQRSG